MTTKEKEITTDVKKQLRYFIKRYYQIQKERVALSNELTQLRKDGKVLPDAEEIYDDLYDTEKKMSGFLKDIVKEHDMWPWFEDVKGIGHTLASAMIAEIDIEEAQHASSIWKYAGQHVICPECVWERKETYETKDGGEREVTSKYPVSVGHDGTCPRCGKSGIAAKRRRGVKADWNTFLKDICWKIGESFVKTKGEYRKLYDESRQKYEKSHPDTSDGHRHAMAKRRTVKRFLADMWAQWREMEGLEVTEPYAHKDE